MSELHYNLYIGSLSGSDFKELLDVWVLPTNVANTLQQIEQLKIVFPVGHRLVRGRSIDQDFMINVFTNQLKAIMIYIHGAMTTVPKLKTEYPTDDAVSTAIYAELNAVKIMLDASLGAYQNPLTTRNLKKWAKARANYEWNQGFAKTFYDFFQAIRVYFVSQGGYQKGLLTQIAKLRTDVDGEKKKIFGLIELCQSLQLCELNPSLVNERKYYENLETRLDTLESKVNEKLGPNSQFNTSSDVIDLYNNLKSKIGEIEVRSFDLDDTRWEILTDRIKVVKSMKNDLKKELIAITKSNEYLKFIKAEARFNELYDLFENFKDIDSMSVNMDTNEREEGSGGILVSLGMTRVKYKQKKTVFDPKDLLDKDSKEVKKLEGIKEFLENTNIDVSNVSTISPKVAHHISTLKTIKERLLENYVCYEKILDVFMGLENQYSKPLRIRETYGEQYNTVLKRIQSEHYKKIVQEVQTELKKMGYMRPSSPSIEHVRTVGQALLDKLLNIEPELIHLNSELNTYESEQSFQSKLNGLTSDIAIQKERISTDLLKLQAEGVVITEKYNRHAYRQLTLKYHPDKAPADKEQKYYTISQFITEWHDAHEAIEKDEMEISRIKKYMSKLNKGTDKPKITSPEELRAYEKKVTKLSEDVTEFSKTMDQMESNATKWISSYREIYDQQKTKYDSAVSDFETQQSIVTENFQPYKTSISDLQRRIQDIQGKLTTQLADSTSVRTKLDRAAQTISTLTQLKTDMEHFEFNHPPPNWFLSEEHANTEAVIQRVTEFETHANKLIKNVSSAIQSAWTDVLETEYTLSSQTTPLLTRMWESITGEKYARTMGDIFEKTNGLSGEQYESALSKVQRRNALLAAGTVGLTAVLFYLYWKGKLYWRKRKLWKRLEAAKPRLMWIIIQPYDKTSLDPRKMSSKDSPDSEDILPDPVTVVPSEDNTYPYDQVMDVIRSTLQPSNDLVLKRLKKTKGPAEYGVQTYMTPELLPDIQSFLWDELMRRKMTHSSLIEAAGHSKKDLNRVYLPVFSER